MRTSVNRSKVRKSALQRIDGLYESPLSVNLVHYICESLEKEDGSSPRVIAIATRNLGNGETRCFSIHFASELQGHGTDPELAKDDFDALERSVLREFNAFLQEHRADTFVHWNMRDPTFGFPALEHRFRVLGGDPFVVPIRQLVDLARLTAQVYGSGYTKSHPHLIALVELNAITDTGLIPGKEEPAYFARGEYRALHNSALRKISVISTVLELIWTDRLRTDASRRDVYGTEISAWFAKTLESWWFVLVTVTVTLFGLASAANTVVRFLF